MINEFTFVLLVLYLHMYCMHIRTSRCDLKLENGESLRQHMQAAHGRGNHLCRICDKVFETAAALLEHKSGTHYTEASSASQGDLFHCDVPTCLQSFSKESWLARYVNNSCTVLTIVTMYVGTMESPLHLRLKTDIKSPITGTRGATTPLGRHRTASPLSREGGRLLPSPARSAGRPSSACPS